MKKLGSRQQKAYDFIKRVNGWHSFDKSTKREILSLEKLGLIEVSGDQFRLADEPKIITCPQCQMLMINGHPCRYYRLPKLTREV